jgi:hypothetical protein
MSNRDPYSPQEHREAMRLHWKTRHLNIGLLPLGALIVWSLLPTILTIMAQSPANHH